MDQLERLQERASVLGNHNLKYLRTIEKVQDRLTRRLEIRGVRDKIHLHRAAPNPGGEMDAIVSVSNDEHDALEFLGCYYAFRFLAMNLGALDELHLELLSGGDRIPIYRQFMRQAGTDFRALTTQYMLKLMDLFVAGGEIPEYVLLGTGTRADQDDIDVGVVVEEEGDRDLLDRSIARVRTEMLRHASCLHFHLSEHVGTRVYSATLEEYEVLLAKRIHDFVIISEMLGAGCILGSQRLFEEFQRQITDRYYHQFGENIYHEGFLRGIVGEIRALLAHPVQLESMHPKNDALRMIKGLASAMKTIVGVRQVNAWAILDELKTRDPDNLQIYETLDRSLTFIEIFRYLYHLLVVQEEDIPLRDENMQENLQLVATNMGYKDVGIVKAWNHLVIHYNEHVGRAHEAVSALMPYLTRHMGEFSIFRSMAQEAQVGGVADSVKQNIAVGFISEAAFFGGTRYWDDVLALLESDDGQVLGRFVADIAVLDEDVRTKLLRRYAACAGFAPFTVLQLLILIKRHRDHPESEAIFGELTGFVLDELKGQPNTPTRFCSLFFLYPEILNRFLEVISDEDRAQVRELLQGPVYDENFLSVREALLYLCDLHIQTSRAFKHQILSVVKRHPNVLHHLRDFKTLRNMARGFFAESQRMPDFTRKKQLLGDYYDFSYLAVALETLAGGSIQERNVRFTEFSDVYIQSLFDLCRQQVEEESGEPVDTRDLLALYAAGGNAREQAFDDDYDMFFVLNSEDEDVRAHCNRIAAKMNSEIAKRGVLPHYRLADHFGHYVTLACEIQQLLTAQGEDVFVDQSQILGSRMVVGSRKFEEEFEEQMIGPLIFRDSERYARQMIAEVQSRHKAESSGTPCTDIKECRGGLRDIEMMLLVIKAKYGVRLHLGERFMDLIVDIRKEHASKIRVLRDAQYFLKNLRDIHRLTSGNDDFIQQESLVAAARAMGLKEKGEWHWEKVADQFREWTQVVGRTVDEMIASLEREEPDLLSLLASIGFDFRGKVEAMISEGKNEECLECDVCQNVCPTARECPGFHPGETLRRALFQRDRDLATQSFDGWRCKSCYECYGVCSLSVCPMEVMFALKRYVCRITGIPPEVDAR
jgi:ferredoxin